MPSIQISRSIQLVIYFLLWCVYDLQGVMYTSGGILSQFVLFLLLLWSAYLFIKVNKHYYGLPAFIKVLTTLILLFICYGIILIISCKEFYITEDLYVKVSNLDYLKNILKSLLPIYFFYYFTLKGTIQLKHIEVMAIILLIVNILIYFYSKNLLIAEAAGGREDFTLNVGYRFLKLLPLIVLFHKRPFFQYSMFLLCLVFVVLCVKRGAIIIAAFCCILFIVSNLRAHSNRKIAIPLTIISVLFICYYINYSLNNNEYLIYRFNQVLEGNSSNRDIIYSNLWEHFIREDNFLKFVFGNGANATLEIGTNYAHNDWLEIAINNGILGLIVYLAFYMTLLNEVLKIRNRSPLSSNVILMSFIILLMTSFFSMSYSSVGLSIAIAIGYVLANHSNSIKKSQMV